MQYFGAQARHFEHFFKGDFVHAARIFNHARVGGVHTINIGVDQAFIGVDRRRHRHGGGVGAATTERGDVVVLIHPLETGDDDHFARVQIFAHASAVNRLDARFHEGVVGAHRHLPAGVADRVDTNALQGDGEQTDRDLFAGGGDHVHFTRAQIGGVGIHFLGQSQ